MYNQRTKKAQPLTEKHPDMPDMSEVIKDQGPDEKPFVSDTERYVAMLHDGLTHYTRFTSNSPIFVIADIECQAEFKNKQWLHIPRTADGADKALYGPGKVLFDVLCVNDKQARRRLEKIVKKWNGSKPVIWHSVTEPDIDC